MTEKPTAPKICLVEFATEAIDVLTLEQSGAYALLLAHRWSRSAAVPDDDRQISRLLGVTHHRWVKHIRPTIERFFDLSAGKWEPKADRIERWELWVEDFPAEAWGEA